MPPTAAEKVSPDVASEKFCRLQVEALPPPSPRTGSGPPRSLLVDPQPPSPTIRLWSCGNVHVRAALLRLSGVNTDAVNQPLPEPDSADQRDAALVVLPRSTGS